MREAAVDPPVDSREPGGDLVDDSVEIVDPCLERDGEVDEVVLARSEQDLLCFPHGPELEVERQRENEREGCRSGGSDGYPGCGVGELRGHDKHLI